MTALAIRTALFVDFDQVFGGLHRVRPEAAELFATQPDRWLRFFEAGGHAEAIAEGSQMARRNILVRKCYLNPSGIIRAAATNQYRPGRYAQDAPPTFSRYRAYFTRAGFSVVDCPPLTSRGKNSADIVMVMDIIDALEHQTRFDEFIILSGDADFAPVLLRLREHDRRTTILADQLTAAAYRAACDFHVGQDDFIERAMGLGPPAAVVDMPADTPYSDRPDPVPDVARAVAHYLRQNGRQQIRDLTHAFQQFTSFRDSRWFGCGTLTRLVEELVRHEPAIRIDKSDPTQWTVSLHEAEPPSAADASPTGPSLPDPVQLRARILDAVRGVLAGETEPIVLAHLAQRVMAMIPEVANGRWPGGDKFADLLRSASDPHIAILAQPPGYAYNPAMHAPRDGAAHAEPQPSSLSEPLRALIAKVVQVSGCPDLTPQQYGVLFTELAAELRRLSGGANLGWTQYSLTTAVYEKCAEAGAYIARDAISFVLTGLGNTDYDWHAPADAHASERLAETFRDNIEALCEGARLELSDDELNLLHDWISGATTSAEPPGPAPEASPPPGSEAMQLVTTVVHAPALDSGPSADAPFAQDAGAGISEAAEGAAHAPDGPAPTPEYAADPAMRAVGSPDRVADSMKWTVHPTATMTDPTEHAIGLAEDAAAESPATAEAGETTQTPPQDIPPSSPLGMVPIVIGPGTQLLSESKRGFWKK